MSMSRAWVRLTCSKAPHCTWVFVPVTVDGCFGMLNPFVAFVFGFELFLWCAICERPGMSAVVTMGSSCVIQLA